MWEVKSEQSNNNTQGSSKHVIAQDGWRFCLDPSGVTMEPGFRDVKSQTAVWNQRLNNEKKGNVENVLFLDPFSPTIIQAVS